ncbi:MAG: ABC transporter substrate-binding protein [Methylococcaceae bacterium]|nr:ABC transporter substrate-binding protein [Methylococcaceae bacterium]
MKSSIFSALLITAFISCPILATEKPTIRLGILAFGTSNWELAALEQQKLLADAAFTLDIHKVATPQAAKIALQAGAVDMIVTDWIWVSRMRGTGADVTFYPYSDVSGALMVANGSGIASLKDLSGKRLAIAGDELDKNWLLLQALAQQQKFDLNQHVKKTFAAPPLLNQQLLQHHADAILNHWHYAAQLEAQGYKQLLSGAQILQGLGIKSPMPNLGYVFKQSFAKQNSVALNNFLKLTEQARNRMCTDDNAWQPIIPLLKTDDPKTQALLHTRYCESRVKPLGNAEFAAAEQIYGLLRSVSGNKLTGEATRIQAGTFWANE